MNHLPAKFADYTKSVAVIKSVVGESWVKRQRAKYEEKISKRATIKSLTQDAPRMHPIVEWLSEHEKFRERVLIARRLEQNVQMIKMLSFGVNLQAVRKSKGFDKQIDRLKALDTFESTSFEIEVAAGYINSNRSIEFLAERNDRKTPDLQVKNARGSSMWVECKCSLTKRIHDERIKLIWNSLSAELLRRLEKAKICAYVTVVFHSPPIMQDIELLLGTIMRKLEGDSRVSIDILKNPEPGTMEIDGRYQVCARRLAVQDDVILGAHPDDHLAAQGFTNLLTFWEGADFDGREMAIRNPTFVAMKDLSKADVVSSLLHSFKSAVKQLPKAGPGIIYLRVPDDVWREDPNGYANQTIEMLRANLRKDNNERVNRVIVLTRFSQKLHENGLDGIGLQPGQLHIEHPCPRYRAPFL